MELKNLNPVSRVVVAELFSRFPKMTKYAEIYVPVSDLDRESDAGSLYVDFPAQAESGLERITIHHRGNCFEIGCYYNGAEFPEEFQIVDDSVIADFVEKLMNLSPNSLKGKTSIRKLLGYKIS